SATKVFGSEMYTEAYRLLMEVVGPTAYLKRGSPEAALRGRIERAYRGTTILTFGGGPNEVQRDLIAMFGLSMPRPMRGWTSTFPRTSGRCGSWPARSWET